MKLWETPAKRNKEVKEVDLKEQQRGGKVWKGRMDGAHCALKRIVHEHKVKEQNLLTTKTKSLPNKQCKRHLSWL